MCAQKRIETRLQRATIIVLQRMAMRAKQRTAIIVLPKRAMTSLSSEAESSKHSEYELPEEDEEPRLPEACSPMKVSFRRRRRTMCESSQQQADKLWDVTCLYAHG